jgi:deazaflavin-dependent oxidoreductase (nitroreductase family)
MPNLKDASFRAFTTLHRSVFDMSKGRVMGKAAGMPVVKLTTTGRKTGARRDTMLTTPLQEGTKIMLVASMGGAPKHPAWYLNLRSNPQVTVTIGGERRDMVARTAGPEERADLWPRIIGAHPNYGGYQEKTSREIPVVVLEPAS